MAPAAAFLSFLIPVAVRFLIGCLDDRGLGSRLGGNGNVRHIASSTGGLVGFRHGRWRVMKDVEGC